MNKLITSFVLFVLFSLLLLLNGCSNGGRYQQKNDSIPTRIPTAVELNDAIPRLEKKSAGGNKDYQVWGKSYQVLDSAEYFEEKGTASWYGKKFHGHLTSNGEIYDMYAMSAAHKHLPLPTYLKVTNLANNKSVIVRVNDRGPFHEERIIDLSYSAAYKLDMLKTGTAKVHIVAIGDNNGQNEQLSVQIPSDQQPQTLTELIALQTNNESPSANNSSSAQQGNNLLTAPATNTIDSNKAEIKQQQPPFYIQVLATPDYQKAKQQSEQLQQHFKYDVIYPYSEGIFRVLIGPINGNESQAPLLSQLEQLGYQNAYLKRTIN